MDSPQPTEESTVGRRLAEDHWYAYNTLSLVLPLLSVPDLLRCAKVCKMWQQVVKDPVFWHVVKIVGCKLDYAMMTRALEEFNTVHLSMIKCQFPSSNCNTLSDMSKMQALRILELDECSLALMETLTASNPNLEVLKANIICGSSNLELDLSFVSKLPKIYVLKLHWDRHLQGFQELLATLNLKHLYLSGLSDLNFPSYKWSENSTLETLGLGRCIKLSHVFVDFLTSLSALKKLRLEHCRDWDALDVLKCISEMNSIDSLELLEINVDPDFENGLKLCSNLKELTIVPNASRFYMAFFNERIFLAIKHLKNTLKKFTMGFTKHYLNYFRKLYDLDEDSIPFFKNFERSDNVMDYASIMIPLDSVLYEVKVVMPFTDIIISNQVYTENVFN